MKDRVFLVRYDLSELGHISISGEISVVPYGEEYQTVIPKYTKVKIICIKGDYKFQVIDKKELVTYQSNYPQIFCEDTPDNFRVLLEIAENQSQINHRQKVIEHLNKKIDYFKLYDVEIEGL